MTQRPGEGPQAVEDGITNKNHSAFQEQTGSKLSETVGDRSSRFSQYTCAVTWAAWGWQIRTRW
jgi:hypothetical protein